jgi:hypothetical protein
MPGDWHPNIKMSMEELEDLGRVHLQIKLKKKRLVTVPDTHVRITIMEAKVCHGYNDINGTQYIS